MTAPYYDRHGVTVHAGDCLDVLPDIPDASVHAVICDPPYGLADIRPAQVTAALSAWANGDREHVPNGRGFMGRDWDAFVPPPAVWDECLRVLTPGGHLVAFAGSRTYDLMGLSIRMAGFEIRDGLQWLYGSGMPKGQDVGKAIDKTAPRVGLFEAFAAHYRERREALGLTHREVCARGGFHGEHNKGGASVNWEKGYGVPTREQWVKLSEILDMPHEMWAPLIDRAEAEREVIGLSPWSNSANHFVPGEDHTQRIQLDVTAPATDAASEWQGWNTSLKPAHEPIVLARKPLSGTVAATVIAHGTGALHVDACRTPGVPPSVPQPTFGVKAEDAGTFNYRAGEGRNGQMSQSKQGRWPANVLLDEGAAAELDAQSGTRKSSGVYHTEGRFKTDARTVGFEMPSSNRPDTMYSDSGGASRFFPTFRYQAKAPASERPKIDGISHPTVKPLTLMRWLVRLVTPPGGLVLDPFAGSGTTLQAAHAEGFHAIGIEREPKYLPLIKARLGGGPRAATGTQTATDNEPMDLLDLLTEDGAA